MALPDKDNSRRAYDKGINAKPVGEVQGEPPSGAGTWVRSSRTLTISGPEGRRERAGAGTQGKRELHRAGVFYEAARPRDGPGRDPGINALILFFPSL